VKTPAAVASASATPAAPAATVEGKVYAFAPDAEVGFIGSKVTGSHEGAFKTVKGRVVVPEDNLEQAVIEIVIDTASITTDDPKLTGHLKGDDFFAVATFPQATFKSTGLSASDGGGYTVSGDLTMHGVTKSISFPAAISTEGDTLKTNAEFSINRKDFGIVYKGKPDDLIRDEVVIKFDINANKEA